MNKKLLTFILGITLAAQMVIFPALASEDPAPDAQVAAEDVQREEPTGSSGTEEQVPETEAAADNGPTEEETTPSDTAEEHSTEEVTDSEEVLSEDPSEGTAEGEPKETSEDTAEATTETAEDKTEEDTTEATTKNTEETSEGTTEETAEATTEETTEGADTAAPGVKYARPVIRKISTDGSSITLEWDNAEGALFYIYRWNILPYQIGTSTTGTFVDRNVTPGRSYTYFIATSSSAYRYPYSQTVSKRVRLPKEDIDEEYKLGEDLSWTPPAQGEEGGNSLVISGSGSMPDFSSPEETPWHNNAGDIKQISIEDGVTYVGDYTFSDLENLEEVELPSSVREYGHDVFRGNPNLERFSHDSGVDDDKLHIGVQYLTGVYSGDTFEPEIDVRKGAGGTDFDEMPELVQGRDYTVTYNNTTEVGDGTIEVTFIGDYADAGSVVIPFTVASDLRKDEKIKKLTSIKLQPANGTYTGSAHHPDVVVRSGRWTLREGVDYRLTHADMINVGSYTVTAKGIGAYSGQVQAVYTIRESEQHDDPQPPVDPSQGPGEGGDPSQGQSGSTDPSQGPGESGDPSQGHGGDTDPSLEPGQGGDPSQGQGGGSDPSLEPGQGGDPSQGQGGDIDPSLEPGQGGDPSQGQDGGSDPSLEPGQGGDPSQEQGTDGGHGTGAEDGKQDQEQDHGSSPRHTASAERSATDTVDTANTTDSASLETEDPEELSSIDEEEAEQAEEEAETTEESAITPVKPPSIFGGGTGGGRPGKGGLSGNGGLPGSNLGRGGSGEPVKFFVGAVGIVASICAGAYLWFFHQFLRQLLHKIG